MPKPLKAVPTAAEILRDAGARLAAAQRAEHDARTRLEAFDPSATEAAEAAAQESVRLADEALQDALADDDPTAVSEARERRAEAVKTWNAARLDSDEVRDTVRGFERRLERAQAEQEAAQAAFTDAEVDYLRAELDRAEASYAEAAAQVRDSYCRTRALHFELQAKIGNQAPSFADTRIRLPVLGEHSRQLRAYPDQYGPAVENMTLGTQMDTSTKALRAEVKALGGPA